jgi:hypothetical protein
MTKVEVRVRTYRGGAAQRWQRLLGKGTGSGGGGMGRAAQGMSQVITGAGWRMTGVPSLTGGLLGTGKSRAAWS